MSKLVNKYLISLIISANTLFFFISVYIFKTNIPWVDDWQWIENLQLKEINYFEWLFRLENIHNHFTVKLLLIFSKFFFNFNFQFFSYLSIFLIFISALVIFKKLNKENISFLYIALLLIVLFSSKQFPSISQMSNISWFLCLFFIIFFYYKYNENKFSISVSLCIFLSPLTLGFGAILPIYLIIFSIINKNYRKNYYIYLILSISSLFIAFLLPRIIFNDSESQSIININNYLSLIFIFKFFYTFFGLIGSLTVPWIEKISVISFTLGLIQFIFLIIFFLNNFYQSKSKKIYFIKFFNNNPLLIMGLIFILLISFTRAEWLTAIQPRYSTGVILFQIGYFLYLYNIFVKTSFYKTLLKTLSVYVVFVFLIGNLTPYLGIHWQIVKSYRSHKIINCFSDISKDEFTCTNLAYKVLFYDGKWYSFDKFNKQVKILKQNKQIFFK